MFLLSAKKIEARTCGYINHTDSSNAIWLRCVIFFSGVLLAATALAKLISSMGETESLHAHDPITGLPFRAILICVSVVEGVIAWICFQPQRLLLQATSIAWMSTILLIYRVSLLLIGYSRPCKCLGDLTDVLHISQNFADKIMIGILLYLLLVGYGLLIWVGWQKSKSASQYLKQPL
jgi:hypothetical protein